MPFTIEQANEIIIDAINNRTTHANYKRVCGLADLYLSLITGEGIEAMLKQYALREDEKAFAQRVSLTISTTDSLCRSVMGPFEKVLRADPLVRRVESKDEKAIKALMEKLEKFYNSENQNSGLDYWFQTRFKSLSFTDPNAFVVIEWKAFNANIEKASPYPYEISSSQAINYSYVNNSLQYLLDKSPITFVEKAGSGKLETKNGYRFTMYAIGFTITYTRVGSNYIAKNGDEIFTAENNDLYLVNVFNTNLDKVPAICVGYIHDELTKGLTYVNPFHCAISWFKKIVRQISEADLSKTNHAFPQKFQYVQSCPGESGLTCIGGKNSDGYICKMCNGKGIVMHSSSQDAIILPLPRNSEDMIDLDKLMVYKAPPIDLLKFQEELIDKYEGKIHAAVFNTQAMVKKTTVATATEREQEMDSVYDSLHPFAEKVTSSWSGIVSHIANITDTYRDDLVIDLRYPNDFKLKSLAQLIADLKNANDSGAPSFVRAKLNNDIAEQTFIDQPEEYNKYQIKQRFYPFAGKSTDEIGLLMVQDYTPFKTKLLYANFDMLFMRAERENAGFWTMKYEQQENIIYSYIAEIEAEVKPKQAAFNPLA